ncbi:GNAT family N-acetyltransferase [Bordetella avium]|uniref:GNAT family N-acetyltransferase n=1 Tax=Bordetella avium TaxID=521 RepID=UPI00287072CA|nr:GNAT family N-acetyltransferase [Bordetella avium]
MCRKYAKRTVKFLSNKPTPTKQIKPVQITKKIGDEPKQKQYKPLFYLFFMINTLLCRPMKISDLPAILHLQARVYPADLLENEDFYRNRLTLAPATCRVAVKDGTLVGYLIAYPWTSAMPPALNALLNALPAAADTWFVHDCAVAPQAQGAGVAAAMLKESARAAREAGLTRASLVALANALPYWRKLGYDAAASSPALAAKLAGYGPGAVYMTRFF